MNRRFRRFVQGSPILLIHDGQLLPSHLAREHLTVDEVERALREHGIGSVKDVSLAVLEMDGSISALKYDDIVPGHEPHRRFICSRVQAATTPAQSEASGPVMAFCTAFESRSSSVRSNGVI